MERRAAGVENFGNGRYVRNVLEQAIMRQSSRLITEAKESGEDISKDKICLLEASDFKLVPLGDKTAARIGFAV